MNKKSVFFLLIVFILSGNNFVFSDNLEEPIKISDIDGLTHPDDLTGFWFLEWDHSSYSGGPGYSPASYGFAENPNVEYFYLLKADGSGKRIERYMNIYGTQGDLYQDIINSIGTSNDVTYQVITEKDGVTTVEDVLSDNRQLYWGINDSGDLVVYRENYEGLFEKTEHQFELDPISPRCNSTKTIDKYDLGIELQILEIGAFKKVSEAGETSFTNKYSL